MKHFSKFTGNNCAGVSFSWNFRPWDLQLHWKVTPAKVLSVNFAKFLRWPIFKNIWEQLLLNQLCIKCIPFWSLFRGGQVWTLFEDNPWMFWRVICTCEAQYYKINYKHEGCKFTKTKVVLFSYLFLRMWQFKTLIHWRFFIKFTSFFSKTWSTKNVSILQYIVDSTNLMKLCWPSISNDLSIVDWFN